MIKTLFNLTQAKILAVLAIGLAAGWASPASAEIPTNQVNMIPAGLVNYQGTLLTPTNSPYADGIYDIQFRVYPASSGGTNTALWGAGYKVFVNNGVFGVMLGQSGGADLNDSSNEFKATELWKALWYDERAPDNLNLFLGITVKQDQNRNPIVTPAEAVPRQQFLVTPFAARAQQAMYARRASGDFNVGGNLTATNITGDLTVGGNLTVTNIAGSVTVTNIAGNVTVGGNLTVGGTNSGFGTIPIGGIILWSGATNDIPTGWALCDGQNGTPDLRDRFVLGAGGGLSATGGLASVTLTTNQLPAHAHTYKDAFFLEEYKQDHSGSQYQLPGMEYESTGQNAGGPGSYDNNNQWIWFRTRTNDVAGAISPSSVPTLPPYFALAYIMRVQ